jgi:hypothetical protein
LLGVDVARAPKARVHEGAWLLAFGVLVVNDHVLKGAGIVPGALTGKLSDFAGLYVAPVVLSAVCALAGARGPRVRALCFAAVALGFSAIKLSPVAARALATLLTACGVPSRFWSDPWDLVALAVLPLAWRTAAVVEARMAEPPRWVHRVAVTAGAFGCVATSTYEPSSSTESSAYVVNLSNRPFDFQLLRLRSEIDCNELEAAVSSAVYEGQFCASLHTGGVLPLDRDFQWVRDREEEEEPPTPPADPGCDAVVLRGEGVPDTLVYWHTTPNRDIASVVYLEESEQREEIIQAEHALVLEEAVGRLFFTGTSVMKVGKLSAPPPHFECSELPKFDEYVKDREW